MKTHSKQKLILIAENEPYTARLLQLHLQHAGYRTLAVDTGQKALDLLFEEQPDLLILDSMLPNLQGYEVCALAKESPETCHIPIMILMPRPGIEDEFGSDFILGAEDYIVKPFDPRELLARVAALEERTSPETRVMSRKGNSWKENHGILCDEKSEITPSDKPLTDAQILGQFVDQRVPGRNVRHDVGAELEPGD